MVPDQHVAAINDGSLCEEIQRLGCGSLPLGQQDGQVLEHNIAHLNQLARQLAVGCRVGVCLQPGINHEPVQSILQAAQFAATPRGCTWAACRSLLVYISVDSLTVLLSCT